MYLYLFTVHLFVIVRGHISFNLHARQAMYTDAYKCAQLECLTWFAPYPLPVCKITLPGHFPEVGNLGPVRWPQGELLHRPGQLDEAVWGFRFRIPASGVVWRQKHSGELIFVLCACAGSGDGCLKDERTVASKIAARDGAQSPEHSSLDSAPTYVKKHVIARHSKQGVAGYPV